MFLNNVLISSRQGLKRKKQTCSIEKLIAKAEKQSPALSLSAALRKDKIQLIAEIKSFSL